MIFCIVFSLRRFWCRLTDWLCPCFSVSSIFSVPTVKLQPESGDSIQVCSKTSSHGKATSNSKHWPRRAAAGSQTGTTRLTVSAGVHCSTSVCFTVYCTLLTAYSWFKTVCSQHFNRCLLHSLHFLFEYLSEFWVHVLVCFQRSLYMAAFRIQ